MNVLLTHVNMKESVQLIMLATTHVIVHLDMREKTVRQVRLKKFCYSYAYGTNVFFYIVTKYALLTVKYITRIQLMKNEHNKKNTHTTTDQR